MSERYINNLTGDFSICFSEHLTEHPIYLSSLKPCNIHLKPLGRIHFLYLRALLHNACRLANKYHPRYCLTNTEGLSLLTKHSNLESFSFHSGNLRVYFVKLYHVIVVCSVEPFQIVSISISYTFRIWSIGQSTPCSLRFFFGTPDGSPS